MKCSEQPDACRTWDASQVRDGVVHTPISNKEAVNIPEAQAALVKEWHKLQNPPAWDVNKDHTVGGIAKHVRLNNVPVHPQFFFFLKKSVSSEAKHVQKVKDGLLQELKKEEGD